MNNPVYKIDREHQFSEILTKLDTIKQLNYPVVVDYKHQFNEIEEKVNNLMDLAGPVYNVEHQHVFKN